ncbi:MAG: LacI family DNA-binding transcriptional regulator [Actinomycetota bacterium]|nr:LacI family DNA-binding transcriptional regulator [Actinomycetota bacterium]
MVATPRKRATIKDVAAACGVSTQTVSRVINHHPNVAPATRHRVQETIAALNYTPSALARGLQASRSNTIGVLLGGVQYFGPAQTLVGIVDECSAQRLTVVLAELPELGATDLESAIRSLIEHRVDGLVMSVPEVGDVIERIADVVADSPVPIVFVRAVYPEGHSSVLVDNAEAIHRVVDHLVDLGRTRIGHISGPAGWHEAEARAGAWRERVTSHGLAAPACHLEVGDWACESGAAAMDALLDRAPDLDAVVVANDRMAFGAMYVLGRRGRRVPEDVAVTGFDDVPEAAWNTTSLTSVAQPLQAVGHSAVRALLSHRDDPGRAPSVLSIRAKLVVRESTAGVAHATWRPPGDRPLLTG